MFTKAVSCIVGPGDAVILPPNSIKTDWEVELGAVIGSIARYVEKAARAGVCGGLRTGQRSLRT